MNQINTKYKTSFLIAFSISILFFIFNFILISNGHFHEDAYILFVYVENFINGNGIAFYPDGSHTEGATDFLWLVFLIFLGKLGLNVGTSVIFLNSVGVFIITYLLNSEILNSKIKNKELIFLLYPFIFLWIFQQPLYAAVGGFSVFLYMALILLAFISVYKERYLLYTPYIGLVIALFRPDGVIIGVGFALIGLYIAYKRHQTKQYMLGIILGLIIGISYFIWRYNYFGNLLPLPLYVKGHGSLTAGLDDNLSWLIGNSYFLIPLIFLLILNKKIKYYLLLASPVILHFMILITVTQSQNVGFRFQAPMLIISFAILFLLIIEYMEKHTISKFLKWFFIVYLFGFMIFGLQYLYETRKVLWFHYINQAPLSINEKLPEASTIVLTEAGRMAYWNQSGNHKIIDIVGLNSEFPAKNTISIKYLEKLSPDMMMYHQAGYMNIDWLNNSNKKVVLLTSKDKEFVGNKKTYIDIDRKALPKIGNASVIATLYLQKYFSDYDVFIIDAGGQRYSHVYAFKKNLLLRGEIYSLLENSFEVTTSLSYYEMLNKLKLRNLNNE